MGRPLMAGGIVPHYLDAGSTGSPEDPGNYSNDSVRMGEVLEVVYASDDRNRSKKVTEYVVQVQHLDANGAAITRVYPRCTLSSMFGSVADRCNYTLRADKSASKDSKTGLGLGAKVLVACINGDINNAVIVGTITDQNDEAQRKDADKDKGHHWDWAFNGVAWQVNKDGELSFAYGGKTGDDGKVDSSVSDGAPGTTLSFLKNGNWKVSDGAKQEQSLLVDKENKKVVLTADQEFDVSSNGKVVVKSKGVAVGDATDATMLGTTYRNAQQSLDTSLQQSFGQLLALTVTAGAALTTAAGFLVIPVVGGTLAAPSVTTAATAITNQLQAIRGIIQALAQFEGKAKTYLSGRNTTD